MGEHVKPGPGAQGPVPWTRSHTCSVAPDVSAPGSVAVSSCLLLKAKEPFGSNVAALKQ